MEQLINQILERGLDGSKEFFNSEEGKALVKNTFGDKDALESALAEQTQKVKGLLDVLQPIKEVCKSKNIKGIDDLKEFNRAEFANSLDDLSRNNDSDFKGLQQKYNLLEEEKANYEKKFNETNSKYNELNSSYESLNNQFITTKKTNAIAKVLTSVQINPSLSAGANAILDSIPFEVDDKGELLASKTGKKFEEHVKSFVDSDEFKPYLANQKGTGGLGDLSNYMKGAQPKPSGGAMSAEEIAGRVSAR